MNKTVKQYLWLATLALLVIILTSSCVTNNKVQYLQNDNDFNSELILDSVLRTYHPQKFKYRIQPHDILSIRIRSLTRPEFDFFSRINDQRNTGNLQGANAAVSGELVDENGEIQFPVIGKFKVAGFTIFEIEEKIREVALEYVDDPIAKVRLLNFRFTVMGEAGGAKTITTFNNRVSMLEAIGLAGGLSELTDKSKIKLIRQYGDKSEVQYINLLDENFFYSPYYYIHQNDVIIIPPLKQRPFRRYFGPNLGLFLTSISTILLVINILLL